MYGAGNIYEMAMRYIGNVSLVLIFLLFLIHYYKKGTQIETKRYHVIFILAFVLVLNDLSLRVVGRIVSYATYYRFFWAIPVVFLIGYGIVNVLIRTKEKSKKTVIILLFVLIFFLSGSGLPDWILRLQMPENRYHIPEEVIQVVSIIDQERSQERPVIVASFDVLLHIRQYDASFIWGINRRSVRNVLGGVEEDRLESLPDLVFHVVQNGWWDESRVGDLQQAVDELEIDYLVTLTYFDLGDFLSEIGFVAVGGTNTYTVFVRQF
ncbi:MAG: hypothetical protein FWE25_00725 [Lachnospiraceae bacterium]|nr:hypothetical protein [Lachnospiraceae bacterium]